MATGRSTGTAASGRKSLSPAELQFTYPSQSSEAGAPKGGEKVLGLPDESAQQSNTRQTPKVSKPDPKAHPGQEAPNSINEVDTVSLGRGSDNPAISERNGTGSSRAREAVRREFGDRQMHCDGRASASVARSTSRGARQNDADAVKLLHFSPSFLNPFDSY
jgi:hypothetical protein